MFDFPKGAGLEPASSRQSRLSDTVPPVTFDPFGAERNYTQADSSREHARVARVWSCLLKEGFVSDTSSSVWRTAYVSAIFETDPARMTLKIADARAAIVERLNSPIEIHRLEHESIEAARQKLATLKVEQVEVVKRAVSTGDTPV